MSRSGESDSQLLERTVSDPEAFGLFHDRFEREVLGFFYRATRRADIAADLTAEVFAAALESASGFNPGAGAPEAGCSGSLVTSWRSGFRAPPPP